MAAGSNRALVGPGQRLREIRVHRGMSLGLLARMISVAVGTIQNYEHGRTRISAERLDQLAGAMQCQVIDLLMPPGSALPKYRFRGPSKDVFRAYKQQDALDHLAAIWDEMRDELRREKGIDIGDQPARDWIDAIRERMGRGDVSPRVARQAYARIRRRLEAYHELLKAEAKTYDEAC